MKKVFMTVIAALALCGSIFAQDPIHYSPNTTYENWDLVLTYAQINGDFITADDNWDDMELASFVGDECRGAIFLQDETDLGDEYPAAQLPVYYDDNGEVVSFRMYNHSNGIEYTGTINIEYVTGDGDHMEIWFNEDPVIINFIPMAPPAVTLTKDITGYGENNTGGHWYLISSPIGDVAPGDVENLIQDITDNTDYDLYTFSQTVEDNLEWLNNKDEAIEMLETGKGYLYASKQDVTLTFTGQAYTGEAKVPGNDGGTLTGGGYFATFDLVYDGQARMRGWNLVGNPFAEEAYVGRDICVMNDEGTDIILTDSHIVAPMEGCFVRAEGEGETVTFDVGVLPDEEELKVVLNLSNGRAVADRAIIRFGESRQMPKLQLNPNSTKVYIPQDGEDYAVVSAGEMGEMPVSFKAGSNGTYTLSFNATGVSFNYLHLIDNMTGADVDLLATPSYSFDAMTTDYASRFRLVFATGNADSENFGFFSDGNFIISNEGEATVQVVDVTGRILSSETINGSASINVKGAAGVYMIRLINGENVKVQKVVVR